MSTRHVDGALPPGPDLSAFSALRQFRRDPIGLLTHAATFGDVSTCDPSACVNSSQRESVAKVPGAPSCVLRARSSDGATSVSEVARQMRISEGAAASLLALLASEGKVQICLVRLAEEPATDAPRRPLVGPSRERERPFATTPQRERHDGVPARDPWEGGATWMF